MKKPVWPIRALLQILSFFVCIALILSLLGTALILDLKRITSTGGLQTIVSTLFSSSSDEPSAATAEDGYIVSVNDSVGIIGGVDQSTDITINSSLLTDALYDILQESLGTDITEEQLQGFLEESNVTDYATDKVASYLEDALTGEENTTITTDELMDLLAENEELLEKHFGVTIDDETREQIRAQVEQVVEQEDLNGQIRQQVNEVMEQPVAGDYTVKDIMDMVYQITAMFAQALGLCLVLMAVLMLLNYYKLPKGQTWIGVAFLVAGLPLALAALVLQLAPDLLIQLSPDLSEFSNTIAQLANLIAPIHYATPIIGLVLIILSIVWRIAAKARWAGRALG